MSLRNVEFLNNEVPGASVPDSVMARMRAAKSKEEAIEVGTAVAREMLEQIRPYSRGVQMAVPFGRVGMVLEVLHDVL